MPARTDTSEARIEVRDLTMAFGDFVVMRDLNFIVRRGDAPIHVAGENHLGESHAFAFLHDTRPALFQLAHQTERIPLDREIQIPDGHARNQVAHRSAGKVHIRSRGHAQLLHAQ